MGRQERARRVPVAMPSVDTMPAAWLRSIRLSGFTIATIVLIVLTVVVLAPSLKILVEQQQELARLQALVDEQRDAVDDLAAQKARWSDPSFLQSRARERLDYVYPGEFTFNVVDDAPTPVAQDGLPISEDIQTTDVDWVGSLLSSALTAGLTEAPPGEVVAPPLDPAPAAPQG